MSVTLKVKGTHSYLAQIDREVLDSLNLANDERVVLRFGDRRLTLEYVTHLYDDNARGVIALHPDHRNELGLEISDEVQIEKVKITEAEMLLARPIHERVPGITQKASRFFRRELSRGLLS